MDTGTGTGTGTSTGTGTGTGTDTDTSTDMGTSTGTSMDTGMTSERLDTCVNICDDDAFLMAAGVTPHQSGQTSKKPREIFFTNDEDRLIVSGWINVSVDPIIGNGQKKGAFWERVAEYYSQNQKWPTPRSATALMNRWSSIQISVGKFCACYTQIDSLNQSGTTDDDKIASAKSMYLPLHGSFPFEHCWRLLRYEQKWLNKIVEKKTKKVKSTPPSVNLDDDMDVSLGSASSERPIGTKAAKQQRLKRVIDDHDNDCLEVLLSDIRKAKLTSVENKSQMYEKTFEIEKMKAEKMVEFEGKRVENEAERIRVKKQKLMLAQQDKDDSILLMNTSALDPDVQAYYRRRKEEILKRRDLD